VKNPKARFGERIKELRLKAGLSQQSLADLAGVHRNYLGETERGLRNIALVNILRLAAALKIHPAKLFQNF